MQWLLDLDQDIVAVDTHRIRPQGDPRRFFLRLTGAHIEAAAVQRAGHQFAVQGAVAQGVVFVGAEFVGGVQGAIDIGEQDALAVEFRASHLAGFYIVKRGGADEGLGHAVPQLLSYNLRAVCLDEPAESTPWQTADQHRLAMSRRCRTKLLIDH